MKLKLLFAIFLIFVFGVWTNANAALITYDGKNADGSLLEEFLNDTGASATGEFEELGLVGSELTVRELTFKSVDPKNDIYSDDFSSRLDGYEIGRSGVSNFDVEMASAVYSFGFQFVEPEDDDNVNADFKESTFEITLFNGTDFKDSFIFSADNDIAYFVGAWADFAFDNIKIREIVGEGENEFFGQFYTGAVSETGPAPIPEPATFILLGGGLIGMVAFRCRRKKRMAL